MNIGFFLKIQYIGFLKSDRILKILLGKFSISLRVRQFVELESLAGLRPDPARGLRPPAGSPTGSRFRPRRGRRPLPGHGQTGQRSPDPGRPGPQGPQTHGPVGPETRDRGPPDPPKVGRPSLTLKIDQITHPLPVKHVKTSKMTKIRKTRISPYLKYLFSWDIFQRKIRKTRKSSKMTKMKNHQKSIIDQKSIKYRSILTLNPRPRGSRNPH